MDGLKNQVLTEKSIRLLQNNQYTLDVDPELTKTEMKNWIELFFDVKVKGINSHRLLSKKKRQRGPNSRFSGSTHKKRMIVTLKDGYSLPLFFN
uniref:Large ribosomal subunit protein uL23c n=1 Tax=Marsilea crenata TaxID=388472 RepID=S4UFX7_MARCR|nr:ribosomal protein L23 [Marsilea crenata]AGI51522.1 ribosomal protein L23 [Marsilea crenata]